MATLITISGNTTYHFVAENVTSLSRDKDADGSFDITIISGADRKVVSFAVEADRNTVYTGILTAIGTVTNVAP